MEGREDGGQADVFRYRLLMATIRRAAPIFPVRNLSASLTYYQRLGFDTSEYEGGGYGFVTRDGIEIHLEVVPHINPQGAQHVAYLWVDDADTFAQAWRATGAELRMPVDTEWNQHEGEIVDPDGNVLRFGSPMERGAAPVRRARALPIGTMGIPQTGPRTHT